MDRPATPDVPWPAAALHRGAACAIAALVVAAVAAWPWTGFASTFGRWAGAPDPFVAAPLACYLAAATALHGRWRWLGRLLAAAAMAWLWSSYRVLTMGDGHWWRQAAADGVATWAEPLSSYLHVALHRLAGPTALEWLPVAAGAAATWVWLRATDGLVAPATARQRLAAALLWASSGLACAFFHRYVEATQLGVPCLLLGLAALTQWSHERLAAPAPAFASARGLAVGAAWLLLATLLHAMYVGMFAAATAAALVATHRARSRTLLHALALVAALAAALGAAALLLRHGPLVPWVGSIAGGGDGRLLTPFDAMFSAAHVALVTFVVAYGTPMALPMALATLAAPRAAWARPEPVAAAAALAYLAFVATYGFDLGWPNDADLMLAMGAALSWFAATWLLPRADRLLVALLLLATAATWCVTMPLVRPTGATRSQANSALATLLVDGVPATAAPGPFPVATAPGETLRLRAEGPPGAQFWILLGPPRPACEGHPYGGVADIEPRLTADRVVQTGAFDPDGRAEATFVVRALPDGQLPGLQMLVFTTAVPGGSTTSAAYYLRAR